MRRRPACAALNVISMKKWFKKNYIFKKNYEKANEALASYGKDEVGPFTDDYLLKMSDKRGCQVL